MICLLKDAAELPMMVHPQGTWCQSIEDILAVIFEMRQGEFQLVDARGQVKICRQKLEPIVVIKGGKVYRQKHTHH